MQLFVSVGALVAGAMFIVEPSGRLLQAPPEMLKASPFSTFLVPGIVLFCVNGIGQAMAGVLTLRRDARAGIVGGVFGLGLVIWLFVQVTLIGGGYLIQNLFFAIGITETTLAFFIDRSLRR
ncbi:MAG: hypothetical protein U1F27_12005 [Turneriella sp.]